MNDQTRKPNHPILDPPVPGSPPPAVTTDERIAVCKALLNGTDMGAAVSVRLPCGAAITLIGKHMPEHHHFTPDEVLAMLGNLYTALGKQIEAHDCDAGQHEAETLYKIDGPKGTIEELSREEFEAMRRKAAH